ncbi:hypothetical protein OFC04_25560, partial [Escherichia coli]|nr:hypothetical protein [Escherichia coli]
MKKLIDERKFCVRSRRVLHRLGGCHGRDGVRVGWQVAEVGQSLEYGVDFCGHKIVGHRQIRFAKGLANLLH